ncbi:PQQ-dependent catabolism-associated CXXCW motif protein [Acidisphaera rubrifaciens]|uniref:Rhodanese domain-containing protein n=1 Tax=Acidisphaera rubrifaciens HS-AP3 TaxID=1231350 RepID=A0A0D6P4D9_9PROT|nr:PQQ-dependent catabolism-associated CXXCW motif protein [Acidisphaera rubrifaciens]GAN76196.1 hypothetical protein Asru_0073_07 [Acidisphaera rubrifaciens HS-AP3]
MRRRLRILAVAALLVPAAAGHAAPSATPPAAPPEPAGYRMDDYHGPVPATLRGATVLDDAAAAAAWRAGVPFIDTSPQPPRPAGLPAGTLWVPRPHPDIPGSLWLPDVGYGAIAPATERYFRDGLRRATGGDRSRRIVIYCKESCWHSWNAAKRAVAWGYTHVDWYPNGVNGWKRAGLPLAPNTPPPRPAS